MGSNKSESSSPSASRHMSPERARCWIKWIDRVLLWGGTPTLILCLLLMLPIVGTFVMAWIASFADCESSAGQFARCSLLGIDIAEVANAYVVGIFLLGMINPVLFVLFLVKFWPGMVWLIFLLALFVTKRKLRPYALRLAV